ncbi:A/G-specific adenine glycosylase [Altererythrobacter aquiaggeris]|uniref:A/G-specific adenine glycosylase n=1 Tax=Aestuarierythrobacter aquiaggeris TaxID=1898396 RepID=UPI00301A69EB
MTASKHRNSARISPLLLKWYDLCARSLVWRAPPGHPPADPYHVWLSEVMLQQTTTAAVTPYFKKFINRWPTVEALAAAPEEDIMAAWAGLGYYSRARNLAKCARQIAKLGAFPQAEDDLRKLPGLGAYTAAAIASIAFGKRAVVVDANVERVVSRLFAIVAPLPAARKAIRVAADAITPAIRAGDHAQAMMDLGATVCTSREPRCLLCPLTKYCEARATGEPGRFPVKPPKKTKPERKGTAFWIERGGNVWLVKRASKGMLGGMRALPDDGWTARNDGSGDSPLSGDWIDAGTVRHVFTHATLDLAVRRYTGDTLPPGAGEWWPVGRIDEAGLPTLFAKAARLASA